MRQCPGLHARERLVHERRHASRPDRPDARRTATRAVGSFEITTDPACPWAWAELPQGEPAGAGCYRHPLRRDMTGAIKLRDHACCSRYITPIMRHTRAPFPGCAGWRSLHQPAFPFAARRDSNGAGGPQAVLRQLRRPRSCWAPKPDTAGARARRPGGLAVWSPFWLGARMDDPGGGGRPGGTRRARDHAGACLFRPGPAAGVTTGLRCTHCRFAGCSPAPAMR